MIRNIRNFLTLCVCLMICSFNISNSFSDSNLEMTNFGLQSFDNSYIENKGQWNSDILFVGNSKGITLILKNDGLYIDAYKYNGNNKLGNFIKFEFMNSNLNSNIKITKSQNFEVSRGLENLTINYIIGNNNSNWVTNVKRYNEVLVHNIYEGIDLRLTFDENYPRYDFIINPGADLNKIKVKLDGAKIIENNKNELVLNTSIGNLYNGKLKTINVLKNGKSKVVNSEFEFYNNQFKFNVKDYDRNNVLIIDPIIYMSYLGGNGNDEIRGVRRIDDKRFVVVGNTNSTNFPITSGAYQTSISGSIDVFYIIFTNNGRFVVPEYVTFLGGAGVEKAVSVGIDNSSNIYITGTTNSIDFPVSSNPLKNTNSGGTDIFYSKFSLTQNTPIFSSYIGGGDEDIVTEMLLRTNGSFYLVGQTFSTNFPKVGGLGNNPYRGSGDGFVALVNASGFDLAFSNFFGGSAEDIINAIDVDAKDDIYLVGSTKSTNLTVVPVPSGGFSPDSPFQAANNGGWDAFVLKYNKGGGSVYSSTYVGGSADDFGAGVLSNGDGTITFAGYSSIETIAKPTFPLKGAFQDKHAGGIDAFIGKLDLIRESQNRNRQDALFLSFFGGKNDDLVAKMRRSENNNFTLVGTTNSNNLPLVNAEFDKLVGGIDIYVGEFSSNGTSVSYCTYLGTKGDDLAFDLSYDVNSHYFVAGSTKTKDFTSSQNSLQSKFGGGETDGLIIKNLTGELNISSPSGGNSYCPGQEVNISWAVDNLDKTKGFDISYYKESDKVVNLITNTKEESSYRWTIPNSLPIGNDYVLVVSHPSGAYDITNSPFSIAGTVTIDKIFIDGNAIDSLCEGGSVKIKVETIGDNPKFQWRFKGTNITGSTSNELTLNNILPNQEGEYDVLVTGGCGSGVASSKVNIKVLRNSSITTQPLSSISADENNNVEIGVVATGSNITYQWVKDNVDLPNENKNLLIINNAKVSNSGVYFCKINGSCGEQKTTTSTTLTVNPISSVDNDLLNEKDINVIFHENILKVEFINTNYVNNTKLYISDNNGNIVNHFTSNNQNLTYDFNYLSNGVYWLIKENEGITKRMKLLVIK